MNWQQLYYRVAYSHADMDADGSKGTTCMAGEDSWAKIDKCVILTPSRKE